MYVSILKVIHKIKQKNYSIIDKLSMTKIITYKYGVFFQH